MMKSIIMLIMNLNYFILNNFPLMLNLLMIMVILTPIKFNFNPLKLMIILIMLVIFISIKMNILFKSWIMLIFPIMMIGGLMIMFMYLISLINNDFFKINYKNIFIIIMKIIIMMIIIYLISPMTMKFNGQNLWQSTHYINENNEIKINELFNFFKLSLLFLMLYLYFCLIVIMNICYKLNTPLRQVYFYE